MVVYDEERLDSANSDDNFETDSTDFNMHQSRSSSSRKIRKWVISISVPNPAKCGQLLETFLHTIEMQLFENVVLPYIRPGTSFFDYQRERSCFLNFLEQRRWELFDESGNLKLDKTVIGRDCLIAHKEFTEMTERYIFCNHPRSNRSKHHGCSQCRSALIRINTILMDMNPVFSRFMEQLLLHECLMKEKVVSLMDTFSVSIRDHIKHAEAYFSLLMEKLSPECKDYWRKYSGYNLKPLDTDSSSVNQSGESTTISNRTATEHTNLTGISFPGRRLVRPPVTFDQKESKHCGKRYPKNSNHSPGLLCVMCACSNPKVIGYVIMTRAESTALALSAIMMYFPIPPTTIFYDNACNTLAAALLRLPWLLLFIYIIVDRFHYKVHSCNALFDADHYRMLDNVKTSVVEAINSIIKRALYNMRFLKGDVLEPYLNVRFALLNLNAKYYEDFGRRDLEDVDLNRFYSTLIDCSCQASVLDRKLQDQLERAYNHNQ